MLLVVSLDVEVLDDGFHGPEEVLELSVFSSGFLKTSLRVKVHLCVPLIGEE